LGGGVGFGISGMGDNKDPNNETGITLGHIFEVMKVINMSP